MFCESHGFCLLRRGYRRQYLSTTGETWLARDIGGGLSKWFNQIHDCREKKSIRHVNDENGKACTQQI